MKLGALLFVLVIGCRGGPSTEDDPKNSADVAEGSPAQRVVLDMPDYPAAKGERLVTVSAGKHDLGGSWRPRAGVCSGPDLLIMRAGDGGIGVIVLLVLPEERERVTKYLAVMSGPILPEPRVSRVGVQLLAGESSFGFQASDGVVEISEIDRTLSGRFAVTLRDVDTDEAIKYVGVFQQIPIEELPGDQCRLQTGS